MSIITSDHFGGNVILTRDSVSKDSPFQQMSQEIEFSHLRYPGGAVTENQTWKNGGLDKMFGPPMDQNDEDYVLTIREALDHAVSVDKSLTIVIPTKQFFIHKTGAFDQAGFGRYMTELQSALLEYPDAKISAFELGNEYWGDGPGGSLTATEYGKAVDAMMPKVISLKDSLPSGQVGIDSPGIGIQAGSATNAYQGPDGKWHPTGVSESKEIAAQISMEHREHITSIFQHGYPHADKQLGWQVDWTTDPMAIYQEIPGFSPDLKMSMSEFNVHDGSAIGVAQGAAWIEAFSANIDAGVDEFMHWGLNYEWLSSKFYDTKFPSSESQGGAVTAIATPMGQVYDLAETHIIGKSTLTDAQATNGMKLSASVDVTGFADSSQKVIFFHNDMAKNVTIDLGKAAVGKHVSVFQIEDVDSPHTPNYDESIPDGLSEGEIADSRGDMHLEAGQGAQSITLGEGEMGVVIISDPERDLILEGAHNATDVTNGMVNDVIAGAKGNDILRGHVGDDTITGGGGRDVISGGEGDDQVGGGDGDDIIFSGEGNDTVAGGDGSDLVVVDGGKDDDRSVVHTGNGADTVLIGAGQQVTIRDFSSADSVGFDGAFEDAGDLAGALSIDDKDLLVALPDEGLVRIVGGASLHDDFAEQVLDFRSNDEIQSFNDDTFDDLSIDQVNEFYDSIGTIDGYQPPAIDEAFMRFDVLDENEGLTDYSGYWEGKDATLDRLSGNDDTTSVTGPMPPPPGPVEPGKKDPSELPDLEDDVGPDEDVRPDEPVYDDEQNHSDASGGGCFVATAAYGDRLHPDVVALRAFRDLHLVKSRAGRAFVRVYWVIGPVLARHTRPGDIHARLARIILSALVARLAAHRLTGGSRGTFNQSRPGR